jgi:peptidoglycan/xylan/chitin deacetylase (PgdA/CDA1 family)
VLKHPNIYESILQEGHRVGNHTYDHLNGWKNTTNDYIENIKDATSLIDSNLQRLAMQNSEFSLLKAGEPYTKQKISNELDRL